MSNETRVCLITGGTSGIGLETAKLFLKDGYRVSVCSCDRDEVVENAMDTLRGLGEVDFTPTDISDESQCEAVVRKTVERFGRIDALANVAGITENQPFMAGNMEWIKRVIDVDLIGTLCMCKYAARQMVQQHGGVIINTSSICSCVATDDTVGYHSAKGAVARATQVLAGELGRYNIRCVSVAPGWVQTRVVPPDSIQAGEKLHMHKRILQPAEIAEIIFFLAQERAYAVNGSQVMADDGYCGFKVIEE